jgi:hypothetical protein
VLGARAVLRLRAPRTETSLYAANGGARPEWMPAFFALAASSAVSRSP